MSMSDYEKRALREIHDWKDPNRLSPEPIRERQRPDPPSEAANGRREPRQFASRAVPGLCRPRSDALQTLVLCPSSDGLATVVSDYLAVPIERIGDGHPGGADTLRRVHVAHDLAARQRALHEDRPVVFPQFRGLVWLTGHEGAEIEARRDQVLVQVERREAPRRVPSLAPPLGETRVERIIPSPLGDPPPRVIVGDSFDDQVGGRHPWARSKSNMSRHADSTWFVSPWPSRSSRDTPSSLGIGRRTTADIRSRLR